MAFQNIRLIGILITAALLLSVPLVAMRFTNEVNWSLADFVVAGILLFGTGLICEFILRTVKTTTSRIAICAGVLALLVLVWIELAVGLFGTPFAGS
ncbi:MAG: hypothetical protein KIS76_04615 [Pyrinomonadaceae bacterium]|nr:hypothetical protein [Pyrinomonadaceae bacterium]